MRVIAPLVLFFAAASLHGSDLGKGLPFDKAIGLHWTNIAIDIVFVGSDYANSESTLLVQKLPDERWLLTEQPAREGAFSRPLAYLTKSDRDSVAEALRALGESKSQGISKKPTGYTIISVQILGHAAASAPAKFEFLFPASKSPHPELAEFIDLMNKLKPGRSIGG